ncbi:guanylate kinase [Paenibacillus xylaniclasticus]|uniref:guanylate kinase n=1 Tax=Paenibacillus xylaniclasticus TaxID=588083 RepID=UPI000FD94F61|nr:MULTISPECIES: hypothetical protein [Paenibacillus]GFN32495.1 hypothetical protein PCURB6_27550 [Paenibacillus curdlanolyticus]
MITNKLFLVSGVSGSGKTTIMRSVMDNELISFTTREPRVGEVNGVDYIFITKDEFSYLLKNNGLIEFTEYAGNQYGLTRKEYENKLSKGDAFVVVDIHGMRQLKKVHEKCISIYVYAEKDEVELNMRDRGDSEESIIKRLKTYDDEINNMIYYDHVVINERGRIDETIECVRDILQKEMSEN